MSLNVHWCISEQMRLVVSSDAWTHPAWRNWLVFPDVYYAYILVRLVVAFTVKYNNRFQIDTQISIFLKLRCPLIALCSF